MGVLTNLLKLLKPGENDYYNQQTEQADNWQKVDDYAVLTNTDKNGIWGGEFGGYIQDPIPKELNKRYIDNINGKAFICIKAGDSSVTSNTIEYFTPCNVVDNLGKLQNLLLDTGVKTITSGTLIFKYMRRGYTVTCEITGSLTGTTDTVATLPAGFRPLINQRCSGYFSKSNATSYSDFPTLIINTDGIVKVGGSSEWAGSQSIQVGMSYICDNL